MSKSKILHLTLKKKWFDLIASGEKKEEYREVKTYWAQRLMNDVGTFRDFAWIIFKNGYAKDAPEIKIEWLNTRIGEAKTEWSDNWKGQVFIIELGAILTQ